MAGQERLNELQSLRAPSQDYVNRCTEAKTAMCGPMRAGERTTQSPRTSQAEASSPVQCTCKELPCRPLWPF